MAASVNIHRIAFLLILLMRRRRRRMRAVCRASWTKTWMQRRRRQGVYVNLLKEIKQDHEAFGQYHRFDIYSLSKKFKNCCGAKFCSRPKRLFCCPWNNMPIWAWNKILLIWYCTMFWVVDSSFFMDSMIKHPKASDSPSTLAVFFSSWSDVIEEANSWITWNFSSWSFFSWIWALVLEASLFTWVCWYHSSLQQYYHHTPDQDPLTCHHFHHYHSKQLQQV